MARFSDPEYAEMGEQGIVELLATEHAAVWTEIEAKIADQQWPSLPLPIQPHHLTTARQALLRAGAIEQIHAVTRGGREVPVIVPTDTRRRKRAVDDAAARKRLLQTRFLTWATGTATTGAGVIGRAGEDLVHTGLTAAAPYGYRLFNPASGQIQSLFGRSLTTGSIDNGAMLTTLDSQTSEPTGQYVTLIEVKNIRSWIYPQAAELHQLLAKAAELQTAFPDKAFLPVLVCRQAHPTTTYMAEHLGFYAISTKRQYVPTSLAGPELTEVVQELAYTLEPIPATPPPALVRHFTTTLQSVADRTATRWMDSATYLGNLFTQLRARMRNDRRARLLQQLREAAEEVHGESKRGW